MKRFLLGVFVSLVIATGSAMMTARCPALFWVLVVGMGFYVLIGRKADVEFRIGVGGAEERRLYGALVWKARDPLQERTDEAESDEYEAGIAGRDG